VLGLKTDQSLTIRPLVHPPIHANSLRPIREYLVCPLVRTSERPTVRPHMLYSAHPFRSFRPSTPPRSAPHPTPPHPTAPHRTALHCTAPHRTLPCCIAPQGVEVRPPVSYSDLRELMCRAGAVHLPVSAARGRGRECCVAMLLNCFCGASAIASLRV
jgi:hypothetical protein